jgi:hypothetical protein
MFSQQHVIVTEKDHAGTYLRAFSDKTHPRLDHGLSFLVLRVRLPGDDQLYRAVGVGQDAAEPLGIVQQQIGTFVGRKAAREAQG